jgi:predicted branched-subunit amino acid permease
MRFSSPFLVVVVPFALLFGAVSTDAGLTAWETMAFSLAVFAGASQFAALQLMLDQAPVLVIVTTALAVNLRMVMYSVALSPHLGAAPLGTRAAMAYLLVDQSFAACAQEFERNPVQPMADKVAYFFGSIGLIAPGWFLSTWVGARVGQLIPAEAGLDFAVPITFLAITAPMIRTPAHVAAAVVSAAGTLALWMLPWGTGLLVAAVAAMAVGVAVEMAAERRSPRQGEGMDA